MRLALLPLLLLAPLAHADDCAWLPASKLDAVYPDRAPWSVMVASQGRCKFISDPSRPSSTLSLTQMLKASPADAEKYAKTVGGGMASSYKVTSQADIGAQGVAVTQNEPGSDMLTLIGHKDNVVVMTQMMFQGGVDAGQHAEAVKLTQATFGADTGGGLPLPPAPSR